MDVKQLSYRTFCAQYKFIRNAKDYHLGEHTLMRHNTTRRLAIIKNHQYSSLQELQTILHDYSGLAKMYEGTTHLCAFMGYCLEESRGIQSINLIYDYHQITLEEEISAMNRRNQKFTEKQLDCFVVSCVKGLAALERCGINNLCLKYSNIVVEGRNTIELTFRLFHTPYLNSAVQEIRQNKTNIENYNLSARQLDLLNSSMNSLETSLRFIDKLKIDKESLGLLVLRMATLDQKHGIYTINEKNQITWDYQEVRNRMDIISKTYSRDFFRKVQYLLLDKQDFESFNQIPSFMNVGSKASNQGSHSRLRVSRQKQYAQDSKTKSPLKNQSSKKYLEITSSKISQGQRQSRISHSNEPFNVSSITRARGESLENSKSSINSKSPAPFNGESPTKIKSNKYQELKEKIQEGIFKLIEKEPNKEEIKDELGVEYIGGVRNFKRNGYGICYFKEGDIYAGNWQSDQIQGSGSYLFHNCDLYTGEVKAGLKHGHGKYIYNNGNYYEGEWRNDKKEGYGVYYNKEKNEKYEGHWVNGTKEGEGIYRWKNGDRYEGGFSHDIKSGSGIATKLDGTKITGQWYNDHLRGITSIKYRSGLTYTGEVKLGINNVLVLEGKGNEVTAEGTKYQGEYKDNCKYGLCKIEFKNGDIYDGNIKDDKFDGFGTYYYSYLGCRYVGGWKNGSQSGKGELEFPNRTRIQVQWNEGRPSEAGKIFYANGDIYEGQISRMGRNGNGVYMRANGDKIQGFFKNGVLVSQKF